jgi:quercetin dioxygenase-like cupin family protein
MTQETGQMQALEPLAVSSDGGDARWWLGMLAVIKTTAADTGGQLTIIEVTNPPGFEAPLHVHHRDDEGFWVLEGSATIEVAGRTIEARAGDYVFGPRDIPHRYTVGDDGCRMLFIMVPGGMEEMIRATSEPAARRTLPPPPTEEPDMDSFTAIVKEHGYELLARP